MDGPVDEALPLRANCWVMQGSGSSIQIAKVRGCYRSGGKVVADLWIYSTEGQNLGRESPAMGGPRSFEPACSIEGWVRIEKPDFPLTPSWVPNERGTVTAGYPGIKVIPFGEFRREATKPLGARPAPGRKSDYDPQIEASARRLAAQEIRDLARQRSTTAELLRERASRLEAEADLIAPRRS